MIKWTTLTLNTFDWLHCGHSNEGFYVFIATREGKELWLLCAFIQIFVWYRFTTPSSKLRFWQAHLLLPWEAHILTPIDPNRNSAASLMDYECISTVRCCIQNTNERVREEDVGGGGGRGANWAVVSTVAPKAFTVHNTTEILVWVA